MYSPQGAVPAGVELCGGYEVVDSIAASFDALTSGDESAAVFNRDIGELKLRPCKREERKQKRMKGNKK